mmetsp:Transcript_18368/g.31067  ORF Transcript_18368/g.31067 Transcript_18368/m.31067 type:complete len:656 (+) Transcript_18368:178-2145(+)
MDSPAVSPTPLLKTNETSVETKGEGRERFSSRLAFYFSAVGSAVGFGNVWRFPSLVFKYGGGAFFIPYLFALFLVGIPLLVLEISLGQHFQLGDVGCFGKIHERARGVGLASIACGYMLVTYYSMLLAWTFNAFFASFRADNFWDQDEVSGTEAKEYFYQTIIGMDIVGDDQPDRLVGMNVFYSLLTWVVIYFSLAYGLEASGKVSYLTMGFPLVILFVFLGRSLTLEGSENGINEYIGESNWGIFSDHPEIWSRAVSQILFSLGTVGIMTAYGSHCNRNEPAFLNSCVVALSNSMFSFISGFAVFATLGHLAYLEGLDSVADLEYSSFGLVFGSWPVALGTLPGGQHWIRLFFIMLFMLGIDSAISFMEAFLTVLHDTKLFHNVDRKRASLVLTACAFLLSTLYATDVGLVFLDSVDYYINFVIILVGFVKCVAAGWVYKIETQIECLGPKIVFVYITTTFGSVLLACAMWFGVGNAAAGFFGLVISYVMGMSYVGYLMSKKKQEDQTLTWSDMLFDLTMSNVMKLREDLVSSVGHIPVAWAFLIRHFIPQVLLILFFLGADATTIDEEGNEVKMFGNYRGYASPCQILGILTIVFAGFLVVSSLVFPKLYEALETVDETETKVDENNIDEIEMEERKKVETTGSVQLSKGELA